MTPEMLAVRQRLFDDFAYYAESALFIRTKKQKIEQFKLNTAQKILLTSVDKQLKDRGYVRIIVLKGRQMGLSTAIGGWLYWWVSQRQAQKALVVAHKGESTQTLFDMTQRFHEKMQPILKPHHKYSSRKELVFDVLDSSYAIVTAGGDGIGRSETITVAHLSELAFWPKSSANANFSGLMDTIPREKGTAVFIESTAFGVSGLFYEQCKAARDGTSDFEFVFLPWFIEDGYRAPVPEGFEHTPVEQELVDAYGLVDEQLMFRRLRIAEKGPELFKQEYPCNADEAFLTSGRPVFHTEIVTEMLKNAKEPIARKTLAGEVDGDKHSMVWEDHTRGELLCYLPHDANETYYLGGDVGFGVSKDFSVAQVFDSKRRQAAMWRSDKHSSDYFGTVMANLGRYYNDALVCCERNGPGQLANRVLSNDEAYPNVYQEIQYDKITDTESTVVGFQTTMKSKPFVIDRLRANVRDRAIEIYDKTTLEELRSFIVTETGRMESERGTHDDTVIALALADNINDGPWSPIVNTAENYMEIE
jgi:hypothetical protein